MVLNSNIPNNQIATLTGEIFTTQVGTIDLGQLISEKQEQNNYNFYFIKTRYIKFDATKQFQTKYHIKFVDSLY